ncbi:MAG: type II toxin-antitoxin system VapC family toxin [Alphaproteobacteria bacterium]|nr:type II toxin-antitoxin system VapC family toxin [Alphaproteobacteria bacterium]MBU2271168.1 type II toxin-antitoxin system VapC family toxin [Alphaproteobacteria bacterium]MBU2417828.1 type II toxin-antitoxin system VapC family toxin [Alphaproteobacteria bacterium]
MIAVDTSALIEVLARQPLGPRCMDVLLDNRLIISAATLTETLIVGSREEFRSAIRPFLAELNLEVIPVDQVFAERAADAYRRWGKGFHAAYLNYGDSFSYALAEMYGCPLLYVGNDFAQTDVSSALPAG